MQNKVTNFIKNLFLSIINGIAKFFKRIFTFFKKLLTGKFELRKKIKIAFFSFLGLFSKNKININDKNYKSKVKKDEVELNKLIDDVLFLEKTVTTKMFDDPVFESSKKEFLEKEKELDKIKKKYIDINNTEVSSIKNIKEKITQVEQKVKKANKTFSDRDRMVFDYKSSIENNKNNVKQNKNDDSIKDLNLEIVTLKENLKKLSNKEKNEDFEYDVYWIKDKIIALKKQANKLIKLEEKNDNDVKKINKLLSSLTVLDDMLDSLNDMVNCDEIEEKEEKSGQKDKYRLNVQDIHLIESSISENLANTHKEVDKLKTIVNLTNPKIRKKTFYSGIEDFFKTTVNLGASMFPIVLFKNQLVGFLTSSILINNRIRTVRKVITAKNKNLAYIEYRDIIKKIDSKKGCLTNIQTVLGDTLKQIEKLEFEIETEFNEDFDSYKEIVNMYKNLDLLKEQIIPKKEEIDEMLSKMDFVKDKTL